MALADSIAPAVQAAVVSAGSTVRIVAAAASRAFAGAMPVGSTVQAVTVAASAHSAAASSVQPCARSFETAL